MAYRGKRSAGCLICRKRKIRCDTQKPSCGQCIKYGAHCTGYRDTNNTQFLDESQHVMLKARNKGNRSTPTRSATPTLTSTSTSLISLPQRSAVSLPARSASPMPRHQTPALYRPSPLASAPLNLNMEDLALNYFYSSFINPNFLSFLPDQSDIFHKDPVFQNAITCTAIASFANRFGSHADLLQGRQLYAKALLLTNQALRDPVRIRDDATLVAVFLLGIFENIDCDGLERMTSWQSHVRGLFALIKLRPRDWLHTPAGLAIFKQLHFLIVTHCMWEHAPVPTYVLECIRFIEPLMSPEELTANRLIWISAKMCDIRANIRNERISDSSQICEYAQQLDNDLAAWQDDAKSSARIWQYQEVDGFSATSDEVWRNNYHVYQDFAISMCWQTYRCTRILVNQMLVSNLGEIDPVLHLQRRLEAAFTRSQLLDDICKGTPWRLGWPFEHGVTGLPQAVTPAIGAYGAQWPLNFAGLTILLMVKRRIDECDVVASDPNAAFDSPADRKAFILSGRKQRVEQLQWIIGRLHHISEKKGIHQSAVYARVLESGCMTMQTRLAALAEEAGFPGQNNRPTTQTPDEGV